MTQRANPTVPLWVSPSKTRHQTPRADILLMVLRMSCAVLLCLGGLTLLRELRQQSSEDAKSLARLASHSIDEEFQSTVHVVQAVDRGSQWTWKQGNLKVDDTEPSDLNEIKASLRTISDSLPDSVVTAAYDAAGELISSHSRGQSGNTGLTQDEVVETMRLMTKQSPDRVSLSSSKKDGFFLVAVLLGPVESRRGILFAQYRNEVLAKWLRPHLERPGFQIYVVDNQKRQVYPPSESPSLLHSGTEEAGYGVLKPTPFGAGHMSVVGYDAADVGAWGVFAFQSERTLLAAIPWLLWHTSLLAILFLYLLCDYWATCINRAPSKVTEPIQQTSKRNYQIERWPLPDERSSPDSIAELSAPLQFSGNFTKKGLWKVISASVAGTSHKKTETPCQDASYFKILPGNLLIGAVADGAGSAPCGDLGAQVAVQLAVDALARHASDLLESTGDEQWNRVLIAAVDIARAHVELNAAIRDKPSRELATTLIVFAARPNMVAAVQVGDGASVLRDKQQNVRSLTLPQRGEYVNATTFIVSPAALKSLQYRSWRGPYSDLAVFTDGLQMLALTMPKGLPHQLFFKPLFEFVEDINDEGAVGTLKQFLLSNKVTRRTDDDLTLLLANISNQISEH